MRKAIRKNVFIWGVAILLPIIMRSIPTSTGNTPRIFELLIPVFLMFLAYLSTVNLISAVNDAASANDHTND